MKKTEKAAVAVLLLIFVSCSTQDGSRKADTDLPISGNEKEMLMRIQEINALAPSSCDISFSFEAFMKRKRYKLGGSSQFIQTEDKLYADVFDLVFKTPLAILLSEADTAAVYSPLQKKLFKYANASEAANYGGTGLDFYLLKELVMFRIPLIKDSRVAESSFSDDGKTSSLILENDEQYESIFFTGSIPNKIIFADKNDAGANETKILFSDSRLYGESIIPKKITLIKGKDRFDIAIDTVKINTPVSVKTLKDIKIPRSVKVYDR